MSDVAGGSLASSSLAQGADEAFGLHDEKNTIALLQRIHKSNLAPDEKNELRDLIFSFRQNPDSILTQDFTAKFEGYGFDLVPPENQDGTKKSTQTGVSDIPQVSSHVATFGNTRPNPQFGSVAENTPLSQDGQTIQLEKKEGHTVTVPAEPVHSHAIPAETPIPTISRVEDVSEGVSEHVHEEKSELEQVATTSQIPASERIKEIKKEVNELVGNPVNLIDVHNEVGREYMNALLDAMKKGNGGTSEEVAAAMVRLEKAFVSVQKTVGKTNQSNSTQRVSSEHIKDTLKDIPEETKTTAEYESPVDNLKTSLREPSVSFQEEEKIIKPKVRTAFGYEASDEPKGAPTRKVELGVKQDQVSSSTPIKTSVKSKPPIPKPDEMTTVPTKAVVEPSPRSAVPTAGGIMSVAKEKKIQDLMTAQKQEAATTNQQRQTAEIASMDPLMTPEVTNGLQQLLSEWSLFKSSGIFGTGANGIEHPLFKKLSKLNMTAIVAGRYEGATPQIKRSITDYMNGWRYEEGIMQEQGELFEHYLRRVIKHILDKRK